MDEKAREAIRQVREAVEVARQKAADALTASEAAAAQLAELLGDDE